MQTCLDIIPDDVGRVYVAYSGGLDSSVLLHLVVNAGRFEVVPWHVNHGLLEVADQMQQFCVDEARRLGLEPRIDRLELGGLERNIEAEARRRRYRLFERETADGDCILTAHHGDDQAETFLLNALRGSGSAGLRGIARRRRLGRVLLLRPLLDYSREQLEAYARAHEIAWFNDPSNRDLRFDRNYLRNQVTPLLKSRWPHFQSALATASGLQAETQMLLDEIAAADFDELRRADSDGIATLDVPGLLQLSAGRRKNLVRFWVAQLGLAAMPNARLEELMRQLHADSDSLPEVSLPGYSIRLYDRRLFIVQDAPVQPGDGVYEFGRDAEIEIAELDLKLRRRQVFERLGIEDTDQQLSLRFRVNGEANDDRHRLKRLFQKYRVPPWRRELVAQVYLDGRLEGLLL